jgi:hypothetical protein
MKRLFKSLFAAIVLFAIFAIVFTPRFSNVTYAATAPSYTLSHYMKYTDSNTLYNMGCNLGTKDRNDGITYDNIVILDFGQPYTSGGVYGTYTYGNAFASLSTIENAMEQYANGFYTCTGSNLSTLRLVMGTSNYGSYVSNGHGQSFATSVNNVNTWLSNQGYTQYITAAGGSDMETSWASATTTRSWADGYNTNHLYALYNYGDAGGCPSASQGGTCNGGWTQGDVYYVSWGVPAGYAIPEIYNTTGTNAKQWQQISLWGYLNSSQGKITFSGSLTQYDACSGGGCSGTNNSPATGWTQLYNTVNSDSRTAQSTLRWSTDMSWSQS